MPQFPGSVTMGLHPGVCRTRLRRHTAAPYRKTDAPVGDAPMAGRESATGRRALYDGTPTQDAAQIFFIVWILLVQ